MKDKKKNSKKFNLFDYKGYLAVLIVLFLVLGVLVKIAFGMIKETYPSAFPDKKVETSKEVIETKTIEETVKETETETEEVLPVAVETAETNKVQTEETRVNVDDPLLILVNRHHPIPEDLTYTLVEIKKDYTIDERVYKDLMDMIADAKKAGYEVEICSAWRSRELQEKLYENKFDEYVSYGYSNKESEELAAFWVAVPGTSEHEIGLAVDIVSKHYQELNHSQADTEEQKWLMAHCQDYGFILRYPEDKQDITHIGYEPWHYRYVGKEAAKEIMASGMCLEEYLGAVCEPEK